MRPRDRQLKIIELVRTRQQVSVDELASAFDASAETIRRDLTVLANTGKIRKVHGGAVLIRSVGEGSFAERMQINEAAKRHIARQARRLISQGDTVFIDTGSTTLALADELTDVGGLTVITNSSEVAKIIATGNTGADVYLLGGSYNSDNRQTFGMYAIEQMTHFQADLALLAIGAAGLSGPMDYSSDEAQIASAMATRSERIMVLADSSKFERTAPFLLAPWEQVDALISEREPGSALSKALHDAEVEVIV